MSTRVKATIEDLYKEPGKAELINGEIVRMSPSGPQHGRAAARVAFRLAEYETQTGKGHFAPDNVGFVVNLPNRQSFSPDAGYYLQDQIGLEFVKGAPLFAAEVRSADDYGPRADRAYAPKRRDYFAAGTQVLWDVDLQGDDVVRVYRAPDADNPAAVFHRGEMADAEPALPGWKMPVDELFK
jgi:Uma2 family endonuclease